MGQGNYQAIVYGRILTDEEWAILTKDDRDLSDVLGDFKPPPVTSYETEEMYLGYRIASSDPVIHRNLITHTAFPLKDIEAYVRRELKEDLDTAMKRWSKLADLIHQKTGLQLGEGELLFVADYD